MANPKKGVGVRINGKNSMKIIEITKKTHRTFTTEINLAIEEYADKKIAEYDNGRK